MKARYLLSWRLLLGAVLCSTVIQAVAADWTIISKTKQEEVLVDMDSYNSAAGIPYISSKTLFVRPQTYRNGALHFRYTAIETTTQFNCAAHTYKNNASQFYNVNKTLVGRENGDSSFKPITSGSKQAAVASLVCQVHQMVGGQ